MTETKHALLAITTNYLVEGELRSYYEGPAGIHDEVSRKFTDKAKAEAFDKKQDWLDKKKNHIKELVDYQVVKLLD